MDYLDEVLKYKAEMKDLDKDSDLSSYDILQPKYDGWWVMVKVHNGTATVITSGGDVRYGFDLSIVNCTLLCEWMYGTNWSQQYDLKGKFFVFDIIECAGGSTATLSYRERMALIKNLLESIPPSVMQLAPTYPVSEFQYWWKWYVEEHNFEGLVFKNSSQLLTNMSMGRMKKVVTMDYIVMGFKEGTKRLEGTLGAIEGGMIVNGKLERICTVGGGFTDSDRDEIWFNKEQYIGRVFEARGKALFSSGALRHPAFTRFRDDKLPEMCIFERTGIK